MATKVALAASLDFFHFKYDKDFFPIFLSISFPSDTHHFLTKYLIGA